MGTDLSKHLEKDLAAGLDASLTPSNFRLSLTNLAEYWQYGLGEATVSDNLDVWTGQVAGAQLTAPSSGQRPTPGTNGWDVAAASTQGLLGAAALSAEIDQSAPYSSIVACRGMTASQGVWSIGNSAAGAKYHALYRVTNSALYARRDSSQTVLSAVETWTGLNVLAASYDGTNGSLYFNGALIDGPTAMAEAPVCDQMSLGFIAQNSPIFFMDGTIHESIICTAALSDAEMASAYAGLAAEYG